MLPSVLGSSLPLKLATQSTDKPVSLPSPPVAPGNGALQDHWQKMVEIKPGIKAILPMTRLDQQDYQFVVDRIQANIVNEKKQQDTSLPAEVYLRKGCESIFMSQPNPDAKGTVLMFHGYTAGPWQYKELAERFFKAGYNVYVPRLPGHGYMTPDGQATGKKMIPFNHRQDYETFINNTFIEAAALGAPVSVIGLSGGSNIALRMAEKFPEDIQHGVAMAPFLGPNNVTQTAGKVFQTLNKVTLGGLGFALDYMPMDKNQKALPNDPMPATEGTVSDACAMLAVGLQVKSVSVPFQFFTTANDRLSGTEPVGSLFKKSGGTKQNGWYYFVQADKVPHAMASPLQNKEPGQDEHLHQMIFGAIDQNQSFNRPPDSPSPFGDHRLTH